MKVKICGITGLEDAERAIELGAWALGFILWKPSKRHVDPAVAAGVVPAARRKGGTRGGVVNQPPGENAGPGGAPGPPPAPPPGGAGPSLCPPGSPRARPKGS